MPRGLLRRHFSLGVILLCSMGITGCWDRTEVNDLAFSMAASIDSAPHDKVRYSKQIAVPGRMGGGAPGVTGTQKGSPYMVVSAVGLDLKDAMQNIQLKMSRRLFLAHRRLFLIGEPLARRGIVKYVDEMTRNPQTRLRTNVAITRGEAVKYLEIGYPFESVPTEALRKILYGEQANIQMDIKGLAVMLSTTGADPIVPIISLEAQAPGRSRTFKADGLAVFKGDRMVGTLSPYQARGVYWLRGDMRRSTVTVSIPGHTGKISLDLHHVVTDYQVQLRNNHPAIRIKLKPEADLIENNCDLDLTDRRSITLVERAYGDSVKNRIDNTLDILQHRYGADVVKFGDRVHHAYPRQWKQMRLHWDQEFSRMPVSVDVNVSIRRIGMTGRSLIREEKGVQH